MEMRTNAYLNRTLFKAKQSKPRREKNSKEGSPSSRADIGLLDVRRMSSPHSERALISARSELERSPSAAPGPLHSPPVDPPRVRPLSRLSEETCRTLQRSIPAAKTP